MICAKNLNHFFFILFNYFSFNGFFAVQKVRWFFVPVLVDDLFTAIVFTVLGGVLGLALLMSCVIIAPKILYSLTPKIDEEKEIARGNTAVAHYFGAIMQAIIIGMSIIIGAAIIAGISG